MLSLADPRLKIRIPKSGKWHFNIFTNSPPKEIHSRRHCSMAAKFPDHMA